MTHSAGPQGWHVPNTSYPWLRPVGQTGLTVSAICAGGSHLASMPENFGYEVSEARAVDLVEAILESPIRFLDTSNGYSEGESERRIGLAIKRHGGLPPDFLVATKVDAIGSDYSGRRVEQSIRESRERLGVERLPLVYLHDPEFHDFEYMTAPGGGGRHFGSATGRRRDRRDRARRRTSAGDGAVPEPVNLSSLAGTQSVDLGGSERREDH